MATHIYGNPCNIEAIEAISRKYNLKVIYDAAHCFGVEYKGKSIFEYGDISTCSFHATKLFHTGEGGALFCNNEDLRHQCFYSHNFGHNGPLDFHGVGINAKATELQAAMGLSVLPYMEMIISKRNEITEFYDNNLDFSKIQKLTIRPGTKWNYGYYPILFESEKQLLEVQKMMNDNKIFPRRYFFPSLNTLKYINGNSMPLSENIASRIMCLPMYHDLSIEDMEIICGLMSKFYND